MAASTRIQSLVDIRPGETRVVTGIAAVFATLELGRGLGEVGAATLVVDRYTETILPWLQLPLGLVAMIAAVGFGAALGRVARARLFLTVLGSLGALLAAESLATLVIPDLAPLAWLTVMTAGAMAVTIAWTVAGSSLDARQAKRLFPLLTGAAIAGAFAGSLAAVPLIAAVGAAPLILAEGIAFGVAVVLVRWVARASHGAGWTVPVQRGNALTDDVRMGFDAVRASPLFQRIALAYVLFSVLGFFVQYRFAGAARIEAGGSQAALGAIYGTVTAIVMAASLVISLLVANRFYARFGVAAGGLALPLVYVLGFGTWVVRFTFTTAAALAVAQQTTQRGISNTAWSAFYNVVPAAHRAQVLAFMDGVPSQVGVIIAGVLALTAGSILSPEQVPWIGLAVALACTLVVVSVRRRYLDALLRTLRSSVAEQVLEGGPGMPRGGMTAEVRAALAAALEAPEAATRSFAATVLAASGDDAGRAAVATRLDDPDPLVRGLAIEVVLAPDMARSAGGPAADAADAAEMALRGLLRGPAAARAVGLTTLRHLGRRPTVDDLAAMVGDVEPAVRAAALRVSATIDDPQTDAWLVDALSDPEPSVRRAASAGLAGRDHTTAGVLEQLESAEVATRHAALLALEGHTDDAAPAIRAWADREVDRALVLAAARDAMAADPSSAGHPVGVFLRDALAARVAAQQDLCLAALTVLGEPAAHGVIRRCLASSEPETRAQAIEALESLRDRRLGAAIARLVEGSARATADPASTPATLVRDDADPWIRALARRLPVEGGSVSPSPDDDLLADLDTMLRLRRVPLFERLSPEDLRRIAMVAREQAFEADERFIHEGAAGDELYVILEGRVVVTRATDDGDGERIIRTYGAGDHIGELAVLRQAPRVASVRALDGPVRTLVLDGVALRTILRERPDAAMAMLATLADRISIQ